MKYIDINTFDINTIERLKSGIIAYMRIIDNNTGKFINELNENSSLVIVLYDINNEEYSKIYEYVKNREKEIPDFELINENDENLPIHLNKRYMICYDSRARMYPISNKIIYFTGNNKVILDDYSATIRYHTGTYTINDNIISINIDKTITSQGEELNSEYYRGLKFQIELIDKETLLYKYKNEYNKEVLCYYYFK